MLQTVCCSPLVEAIFASLVGDLVLMIPLCATNPQKGGLYRSTKSGLFVLYDTNELVFCAMEEKEDYGQIIQMARNKIK